MTTATDAREDRTSYEKWLRDNGAKFNNVAFGQGESSNSR